MDFFGLMWYKGQSSLSSVISWMLSIPKGFGNDARNPVQRERKKHCNIILLTLYGSKFYIHSIFARTQEFPIQPAFKVQKPFNLAKMFEHLPEN